VTHATVPAAPAAPAPLPAPPPVVIPAASSDLPPGAVRILPPAPPALPAPGSAIASAAPVHGASDAAPGLLSSAPAPTTTPDGLRIEAPDKPAPKVTRTGAPDTGFMRMHEQYVQKAKAGNIDLYLLGDSITDFWEHRHKTDWDKHFGGWKAGDFGISGDRTQHVLWRIENGELEGVSPKAIVLLIGTNNLAANAVYAPNTVDDTFKGIKAIVDTLKRKEPQAHLLLMAVFPREDKPLKDKIDALNAMLPQLADGQQVKLLNINDKLTDAAGKLLPGVMLRDNLHPDDKGYDLWADAMAPTLT
jgi:lysophospholipase L1-like esterase